MKQELDDFLCAKYPKIFAQRKLPMTQTAMCWGFECGDGWYNIINSLCFQIQNHIDWANRDKECVAQVEAVQVKEKYGTLRFYYSGGDDTIRGMVTMAEAMSAVTCETCGAPGKVRGGGWHYTACDAHTRLEDKDENDAA